jgi:hypothetical protein
MQVKKAKTKVLKDCVSDAVKKATMLIIVQQSVRGFCLVMMDYIASSVEKMDILLFGVQKRMIIVGVLDRQTYQGGTRGSRLCGEDRDREAENSKVCARTRDTRFIQVRVAKVANPRSCLGDPVWRPALGVG